MYKYYTAIPYRKLRTPFKIILIVKLILVLLIPSLVYASSGGYAQSVTLNKQNVSIKEILNDIREQTGYSFILSSQLLKQAKPVNIAVKNTSLAEALDQCFSGQTLSYIINNKTIIVSQKKITENERAVPRDITITGKITDEKGLPLPGVNVTIKGKTTGTTSDANGSYRITVTDANAILVFSFIGMESQEVPASKGNNIDIVLKEKNMGLQEVVVVGYGTQARKDITGAVSSIREKDIHERPINNMTQALQGKSAGVYVTGSSNEPGAGTTVYIRGKRSIDTPNEPLYVIDGIPINGGFNDLNPDDIVSMDILKDASATAIYGSRGANGVVIVTTRRGKAGATTVTYNAYAALSAVNRYIDVMNGPEFAEYKRESRRAAGKYDDTDPEADSKLFEAAELASIADGTSTDWQKLMLTTGVRQNHELNINGGAEKTRYSISFGFMDDKGYIPTQRYTRYTSRINLDQEIGTRFKAGLSTLGMYSKDKVANPYYNTLTINPLAKPYDENGNLVFTPTNDVLMANPLADLVDGAFVNNNKRLRLFSSIYGEAKIAEGLTFRMNFGPDLIENRGGTFNGSNSTARNLAQSTATTSENFTFMYTWENILNYKKTFAGKHRIDLTGLYSISSRTYESTSANVQGLPLESFEYYNIGAATTINGVGSNYQDWAILSYMGRANYAYDNKYLVTFTARADGSSRFGTNNKWGFFPSAALGWNIASEDFLVDKQYINNLKLRLSYGKTGNTGINPYQTQGSLSRTSYDFGGSEAYGYRPSSIRNNDLRWESTASANLGIDFGFFNNRISGSVEVYRSKTTDLLLNKVLPASGGFDQVLQNIGATKNRGLEIALSAVNIRPKSTDGFTWSTDLNIATSKEKITELSQGKVNDVGNKRFIGEPIKVFYDYKKIGIWQLGEEAEAAKYSSAVGQVKVQDINGNGKIDPDDRIILGSELPDFTGGITNRFTYKRFSFSALILANSGNMFQSSVYQNNTFTLAGRYNNLNVNYWTKENPTNDFPQPNNANTTPLFKDLLTYFDGSFVRIKNLYIGYDFASAITKKLAMKTLRIYGSVQDPFTFAPYIRKYHGTDPEIPGRPSLVTYTFGLNASF